MVNSTPGSYVINLMQTFTNPGGGTLTVEVDDTAGSPVAITPAPVNNTSSTPGASDGHVKITSFVAVPEPGTMALVGVVFGLAGVRLALAHHRRLTDVG